MKQQGTSEEFRRLVGKLNKHMKRAIEKKSYNLEVNRICRYIRTFFDHKDNLEYTESLRQQFIRLIAECKGKKKPKLLKIIVKVLQGLFTAASNQRILEIFIRSFRSQHFYDRMTDVISTISFKYLTKFQVQIRELIAVVDKISLAFDLQDCKQADCHNNDATHLAEVIPIQHSISIQPPPPLIQQKIQANNDSVQIYENPPII
ncbi:predicted protein [Naegleria gruberi]|uniref:Predicted protein n=1 Tax=Naegleria gruberi TaxID=5762 RepID=D2W089_NAEGR|nr:uncharacterized protein NAEGRDRAFT_74772 [Naegleria gruberi]EFC37573.1 predicted protein [Naegleria gruberi]|eukprot:XP_002670317.1 predicted protein [Naegleria gruberi strain NEG-M]